MVKKNFEKVDENLCYVIFGFEEGVIVFSNVFEVYIVWLLV